MVKFYRDTNTNLIHRVADFPSPKRDGHTQCGRPISRCKLIERKEVRKSLDHEFCLKCYQLVGNLV